MTQEHPVTPPPELRWLWAQQAQRIDLHDPVAWMQYVSEKAAQWGADQELEACCEWLKAKHWIEPEFSDELRAARRSKPPSLKEQALKEIEELAHEAVTGCNLDILERAIKSIPD